VVVLDGIIMKKVLYVAFSMVLEMPPEEFSHSRRLVHDGSVLSESAVFLHSERTEISSLTPVRDTRRPYVISMQAVDEHGNVIGRGSQTVEHPPCGAVRAFHPSLLWSRSRKARSKGGGGGVLLTGADKDHGYVLFARSPLIYVYPDSNRNEISHSFLSAQAV